MRSILALSALALLILVYLRRAAGRLSARMTFAPVVFLATRAPVLGAWALGAIFWLTLLLRGMQAKGIDSPGKYAMALGIALLCGGGVAVMVVGPIFFVVRALGARPVLPLEPGETLLLARPANHFLRGESRAGRLLVTSQRLAFEPHRFNVQLETWSTRIEDIERFECEGTRLLLAHVRGLPRPTCIFVNSPRDLAQYLEGLRAMPDEARVAGQQPIASQVPSLPTALPPDPPSTGRVVDLLAAITPVAWVTPSLVALIVLGFGVELYLGASATSPTGQQLLDAGADFGPYFLEGQWWRALSSMFLHAGLLHIAFNLWAFWQVGRFTERLYGNAGFLALYFLAGIGGSLTSLAWNPLTVSVGASGAIFGVYGALLAFVLLHRGVLPEEFLTRQRNSLLGFIGYNVIFGLTQKNIDMAAHAGGLITGALCGALLSRDLLRPNEHAVRRVVSAAIVFGGLVLVSLGVRQRIASLPEVKADRAADAGYAALSARELPLAIERYSEAISIHRENGWLINRGLAYMWNKELPLAQADFKEVHAVDPSAKTHTLLCDVGVEIAGTPEALEEAVKHCSEAHALDPKNAEPLENRALARTLQKRNDEAITDAEAALLLDANAIVALRVHAQVSITEEKADQAEQDCPKLLKNPSTSGVDYRICARVAGIRGDLPLERSRLDGALALDPTDRSALGLRAWLSGHEGRLDASLLDYDRLVTLAPDVASNWNNRAWLEVEMGYFAKAKADADRALAIDADSGYALGTRCFALAGLGELETARADCARASELTGSLTDRGMLAFLDKRYDDARRAWERASKGDDVRARELRPWVARLP